MGTFSINPTFAHWAHWSHLLSVLPMYPACAWWVFGSLSPVSIFLECVKWSRIVIHNIPTNDWDLTTNDFQVVSREQMEIAVRASHPLLTNTTFMEGPDWTAQNGPSPSAEFTNISFAVPDPDESRLSAITKSPLVMFGTFCNASRWTEKIALVRCPRCWKYGATAHSDCPIRCRRCGGNHPEESHHVDCTKCVKSDINQEDRSQGLTTCSHPASCPNCGEEHFADDTSCKMRNFAACKERRRRKVGQGQRFITSYTGAGPHAPILKPFQPPTKEISMEQQQLNDQQC